MNHHIKKKMHFEFSPPQWSVYTTYTKNFNDLKVHLISDNSFEYLPKECMNLIYDYVYSSPFELLPFLICFWSWDILPSWYYEIHKDSFISETEAYHLIHVLFPKLSRIYIEPENLLFGLKERKFTLTSIPKKKANYSLGHIFILLYLNPDVCDFVVVSCWFLVNDYMKKLFSSCTQYQITIFMLVICFISNPIKSRLQLLMKLWLCSIHLKKYSFYIKSKIQWIAYLQNEDFLSHFVSQFPSEYLPPLFYSTRHLLTTRTTPSSPIHSFNQNAYLFTKTSTNNNNNNNNNNHKNIDKRSRSNDCTHFEINNIIYYLHSAIKLFQRKKLLFYSSKRRGECIQEKAS